MAHTFYLCRVRSESPAGTEFAQSLARMHSLSSATAIYLEGAHTKRKPDTPSNVAGRVGNEIMSAEFCLIVDFGSQYTQLIARKLRELGVKSEVVTPKISLAEIKARGPKGVILSGGPSSVFEKDAPTLSFGVHDLQLPVLGICYGMQWIVKAEGGKVSAGKSREYGVETISIQKGRLFGDLPPQMAVLMSHGDHAEEIPADYRVVATTRQGMIAAIEHTAHSIYGLQFHPEVHHTPQGLDLLRKFLLGCRFKFNWKPQQIFDEMADKLRAQVKDGRILCALSGGVDSAVVAAALNKIFPGKIDCFCVDTGLLRKGELNNLKDLFQQRI